MEAEEALALGELTIKAERECEACEGTGRMGPDEDSLVAPAPRCPDCNGSGRTEIDVTVAEIGRWVLDMMPTAVIPRGDLEGLIDAVKHRMVSAASRSEGLTGGPVESAEWLRVVQEAAHTLRELTALLVEVQRTA